MLATVVRCAPIRSPSAADPGAQEAARRDRLRQGASLAARAIRQYVTQGNGA